MADIKETKEGLIGALELSVFIWHRIKDGPDFGDAVALWKKLGDDEEFKNQLFAAYKDAHKIPGEIADLSVSEASDIVALVASYIPKFLEA